jgi:NADH pyrophosphatase NudC (nudix superfamily)
VGEFFNVVKQGLGKGVTTLSVKSREMIEATRVKSELGEMRQLRLDALRELGEMVYASSSGGSQLDAKTVKAKSSAISALEVQIKQKEEELEAVHARAREQLLEGSATARCVCGADLPVGVRFCGQCGKKTAMAS